MLSKAINWLNGWRPDMDGFLVRARRATDPTSLPCHVGFVEESSVAVRNHQLARAIDSLALKNQESDRG